MSTCVIHGSIVGATCATCLRQENKRLEAEVARLKAALDGTDAEPAP